MISIGLDEFEYRSACPSCRSRERIVLSTRTVFRISEHFPVGQIRLASDVVAKRTLYRCDSCGLVYFSLVPTKDLLRKILDKEPVRDRWEGGERPAFSRGRAAVAQFLPAGNAILDIGAHTGGFLRDFDDRWQKFALEPMEASSQALGQVFIFNDFLEEADLPNSAFDCISAFDVFEHFHDPCAAVERIKRALKPDGILVLETGNADSVLARLLGAGWYYLSYLEHFQAFSSRSLRELLNHHGFEVLIGRKTFHDQSNWRDRIRVAALTAAFVLLTMGKEPGLWRRLASRLRPGMNAVPPMTASLEPDHLFFVARNPAL